MIVLDRPMDRLPRGGKPAKSGRAARTLVGRFNSPQRRRDILTRLAARVNNAARVVTVADLLAARGASADLIRKYSSAVGRAAAKAYRATGAEPKPVGLAATARGLVWGFGYDDTDRALLDTVIDGYEVKTPKRARLLDLIGA